MDQISFTKGREILDLVVVGAIIFLAVATAAPIRITRKDDPSWTDLGLTAIGLCIWLVVIMGFESLL